MANGFGRLGQGICHRRRACGQPQSRLNPNAEIEGQATAGEALRGAALARVKRAPGMVRKCTPQTAIPRLIRRGVSAAR